MPQNPIEYTMPNGEKVELYPIGHLAFALGRDVKTIRCWEIAGIIPKTPFKNKNGLRLYTQEMIDVVSSCAERCKLVRGKNISNTNFTRYVTEGFNELYKKYCTNRFN